LKKQHRALPNNKNGYLRAIFGTGRWSVSVKNVGLVDNDCEEVMKKVLVTGAAGSLGSVGRKVIEVLRKQDVPVRAFVRTDDERAQTLRDLGAEIFVGDLNKTEDVVKSLKGCDKAYFGMSVSAPYLEASCIFAAAALDAGNMQAIVNMSQMTVSEISLNSSVTNSPQHRLHCLAEQAFNWSQLPVIHVRPTVFLEHFFFTEWAAQSISKANEIRLPFGNSKTSPIATYDVARVVATILNAPEKHVGHAYELTGPKSQDLNAMAIQYAEALNRPVKYVDLSFHQWLEQEFLPKALPQHVSAHIKEMAKLHAAGVYDRFSEGVEVLTGQKPMDVASYVRSNEKVFGELAK